MEALLLDTIEITKAAGDTLMAYYRSAYDVNEKSSDNPVTEADYAADTLLKQSLTARLPEAGWLSEETVDHPDRRRIRRGRTANHWRTCRSASRTTGGGWPIRQAAS